jgi:3-oxoacyl-(acyl-carrier-protein) synthase
MHVQRGVVCCFLNVWMMPKQTGNFLIGGCVVILTSYSDPIVAIIKASAVNHDSRTQNISSGQVAVMQDALRLARLSPCDVSYVELNGTGTLMGDRIEIESVLNVRSHPFPPILPPTHSF